MARSTHKLDELAALLEKTGGDPRRLDAVRATQSFRRSWLDLARTLAEIRKRRSHEGWGYPDFYEYCAGELTLKRATVDKLTISFHTIERHAPQVLSFDGVAKTIPSYEAIDYFARAMGPANEDPEGEGVRNARGRKVPPDRVRELSSAVFDEGRPVAELRKSFDGVFFPRSRGAEDLARISRASAAAHKLVVMLSEIPGLPTKQLSSLEAEIGRIRAKLDELAEPLRESVAVERQRVKKQLAKATPEASEEAQEQAHDGAEASPPLPPRKKAPRIRAMPD